MNNSIYKEQQKFLDEVAEKLGIVCFRPSYHGKGRDANTVLFYTMEDEQFNRQLEAKHGEYVNNTLYKPYIWNFENTDFNGFPEIGTANRGRIKMFASNWRQVIENCLKIAIYLRKSNRRFSGTYYEIANRKDCQQLIDAELTENQLGFIDWYLGEYGAISEDSVNTLMEQWIKAHITTDDFVVLLKSDRK